MTKQNTFYLQTFHEDLVLHLKIFSITPRLHYSKMCVHSLQFAKTKLHILIRLLLRKLTKLDKICSHTAGRFIRFCNKMLSFVEISL